MSVKDIGAQGIEQSGNHLVRKPTNTEQRNCGIRAGDQAQSIQGQSSASAPNTMPTMRELISCTLNTLHDQRRQIATEYSAEVSRQEGQPSEDGNLGQIHVANGHQIEGNPEIEGLPRRFRQKAWNSNSPKL